MLTACGGESKSMSATTPTTIETPAKTASRTMPNLIGFMFSEGKEILALQGFEGKIETETSPFQGKVEAAPQDFLIVAQSPWAGFDILGSSVSVTATQMGVTEQETLFLDSFTVLQNVLEYVGSPCEENRTSEAKYPDKALDCSDSIVVGLWTLETEFSKRKFEIQRESYSESASSLTVFGANWTVHGDKTIVEKVHKVLGGTLVP